ncbi:Uncharacterized protein BP5553_10059 [Venustampulla echinocandica]|uniref:Uncharacterized protein n=1 Tax=Venustampulla echinocandica TaxID=2656787 RepID=A0A370TA80_9HELO|nr:Uncharacterized protein BP5553_10059 [Venustampulla echinocandica]RDL30714.1 Uncharacterized protein BP5553_10059 [Venustampulla echinocandica]
MATFFNPVALLLLLAAQCVAGAVIDANDGRPHDITTVHLTTVTITTPPLHTCYTKTIATPKHGGDCPDLSTCGYAPACIRETTTTVRVPPADPRCSETPTVVTPGPCETCATGCRWDTSTVWATPTAYNGPSIWKGGPTLASGPRRRDTAVAAPKPSCATTLYKAATGGGTGFITTYHPLTETRISLVNCGGCSLVISELQGVGPQITRTATVTDLAPAVFTTFSSPKGFATGNSSSFIIGIEAKQNNNNNTATMPVVKGGVWTNIEDEVLKSSVSKYGLNQWARVSSLLARKTPKQCKARWAEWLDPGIRKIEWSKEEDEKLLHLAKLMPTQWRTIAPMVGRTASQCLERYQRLLDEAEQKEAGELSLAGPDGGETKAPSADDVRRLRPGEVDPDPESKPARPDTIDLDEDEKEMLSEARARLANTQGKKAKRKARERQLEESRRLAVLQKRRELKNAGINIKVTNRKKGQMDYNADIPFEKKAASGFYDTEEEDVRNEREREAFDPRKQQLANKRKGDPEEDPDRKRRKGEKEAPSASYTAAMKAGQLQKIREAEQSSKRRALVLPSPQVGEGELEEIVKMGMIGERANIMARSSENDATRGLVNTYSTINSGAPIRTPRAPAQEDHIANEIRNIRALTETQSSLLGGENTPLYEGAGSTGFDGVTPRRQHMETPNPMATPFRQATNGVGATPMRPPALPGATPMRTPRDPFALNADGDMQLVGATPRDIKLAGTAMKHRLKQGLASLPKPKDTDWELELPDEQEESAGVEELSEEDAELRDRRNRELREAQEKLDFKRRTKVMQMGLPRASAVDIDAIIKNASNISDPVVAAIEREAALLIANDALRYPLAGAKVKGTPQVLDTIDDDALAQAQLEIMRAVPKEISEAGSEIFQAAWEDAHSSSLLPGLGGYGDDEIDEHQMLVEAFDNVQDSIVASAEKGNKTEKKLTLHLGGYQNRSKILRNKISEADDALGKATRSLDSFRTLQISEEAAIQRRLEALRDEVAFISKREREAQDLYKARKEELDGLSVVG